MLQKLKKESRHGKKPQLKNLFIDTFNRHTECFIARDKKGNWNAAITYSYVSPDKVQAELLLRRSVAPSGTMEALIERVIDYLKEKGYHFFSLGEVPFEVKLVNQTLKSRLICAIGRTMHFAYNSDTLYRFKNKFQPSWQPIFLCGYPRISILSLFEMAVRSNYVRLIVYRLFFWRKN
jgi:lysylphosphatidylglycerol synthetase-like protein (DUF2156 family)